jgi:acetyl-CoA carboxylase carboxyl transferase subunit beta
VNWIVDFVRPKIQALINHQRQEVPDNLWTKCPKCEHMLFHRDMVTHHHVCHHCRYHFRLPLKDRFHMLFDDGKYTDINLPQAPLTDPLKFRDSKRYTDRLKEYRGKTNRDDALMAGYGTIGFKPAVIVGFDFAFMGGSMGQAVGHGFMKAAETAVQANSALIAVTSSGGARMQEGIFSLMQMPRTVLAVQKLRRAGLPYITLLADPTTGGVSASFAMLGDVALAEPGTLIGFTGARVIEETLRQKLPDGFQTAEYVLDHGMIDQW